LNAKLAARGGASAAHGGASATRGGALRTALLLGPSLNAISGVTTHVATLLRSPLRSEFALAHFQVGSEGRSESAAARLARLAASPFTLAAAILRSRAAIVHLNTSLNAKAYWRDLAYLVVARLCGARVVLQKHGGTLRDFCRNRIAASFVRNTLKLADAIVVLSRAEMSEYRGIGNVVHLPNGIDCAPYLRYNRSVPASGPLQLAYIGRLAPRKGLAEILEALSLLGPGVAKLVIAGSGPDEAKLRLRAKSLGVARAVHFLGPACGEDKARLLSQADVLLLPSHSEGLPYALLEAMAAGVVPVVTPVGAIPEVVEDGVHGKIVPVGDAQAIAAAVEQIAADRASLARMSAACRARIAAAYSIDRLAGELASLYSKVL
jgi:glycosyltransferase involved in cell wall biosynthesis